MNKVSLIALLLAVSFVNDATAGKKADGAAFAKEWDVSSDSKAWQCLQNAKDIVGVSAAINDLGFQKNLDNTLYSSSWSKGAAFYIAHEMTERGYKFCKTIVSADRTNCSTTSFTEYWYSKSLKENPDCFWLCKPGWYDDGTGCNSKTMVDMSIPDMNVHADRATVTPGDDSDTKKLVEVGFRYSAIESTIPMLVQDRYIDCSGGNQTDLRHQKKKQEHDVVLAIKDIKVDKDNYIAVYTVAPLVVRAAGTRGCLGRKASETAWALTKFLDTKTDTSLCPGNMVHQKDSGKAGCIASEALVESKEISESEQAALAAAVNKAKSLEEQGLAILCDGWTKEKYNNKLHVLQAAEFKYSNWRKMPNGYKSSDDNWTYGDVNETCTIFVCKDGKGYKSDPTDRGDFTCVSCTSNDDTTIHPSRLGVGTNGVCLTCKLGEVFNEGVCEPAKQIHKAYMAGDVNSKALGTKLDPSKQCWTKPTPDEYKSCMDSNGWSMYASSANDGGGNNPPNDPEPSQ